MSFIRKFQTNIRNKQTNNGELSSFISKQTNETSYEKRKSTKIKTVNFNGVEIIEVESYKSYNQLGGVQLESLENNITKECQSCNCILF